MPGQNPDHSPEIRVTPTPPNPAFEQPTAQLQQLTEKLKAALDVMQEAKTEDGARWAAARDEVQKLGVEIQTIRDRIERDDRETATAKAVSDMQAFLQTVRSPSKAAAIGGNMSASGRPEGKAGLFLGALLASRSSDHEAQQRGKATLSEIGVPYEESWGKATLGDSDAAGGYIIPNNLVDQFLRPALYKNKFRTLLTNIEGVTSAGVDIPYRNWQQQLTTRAVVATFGSTKANTNLAYDGYTATMYTLARIYDLGKQFVRQSQGAAEQDVMTELGDAFARGEGYYVLRGSGSSEPYGLLTALDAAGDVFDVAHTPDATTVVNSVAAAITKAAGALGARSVDENLSAIMGPAEYWQMLREGTAEAGFFFNPAGGPNAINGIGAGVLISPFGIPVYPDINMEAAHMIVGDFKKLKVYHGENFRVDTSETAGTRWDTNLIGFRGEMEMGLDARPAVYAGHFALVEDITP